MSKSQRGFTLTEILLVMMITSVLVLGVNMAFRQAHMLWARIEKQRPVYQKTRLFFGTLQAELTCLYLHKIDNQEGPAPFALSTLQNGDIKLSFFTLNPAWKGTAVSNLPMKVSYEFTSNHGSGGMVLSRTERLFSGEKAIGEEEKEIVLRGFSDIDIQVADMTADSPENLWKNNIQCTQSPPRAVKIILKWQKDGHADFVFESIIKVVCQAQITSS